MSDRNFVRRRNDTRDPNAPAQPAQEAPAAQPSTGRAAPPQQRHPRRVADMSQPDAMLPEPSAAEPVPTSGRLAELEALAGGGAFDMADLLGATSKPAQLQSGTKVRGTVSAMSHDELHVDLGARATGFLHRRELPAAKVGDVVEAWVVRSDDLGVQLTSRLSGQAASDHLIEAAEAGIPVDGLVQSRNAGGYEVRIGGARAFCPVSQIARVPLADPDSVLGQTFAFLVVDSGDKLVVSRRKLEERELTDLRAAFWANAREGDIRVGTVTGVTPQRAWVDVDGAEARLSRREFGWEDVADLTTRLQRGQRVQVRIIELDAAKDLVSVSLRDPGLDPWKLAPEQIRPGELHTGKVISQAEFGAFIELLPGLQGLLHVSRLAGETLPAPGTSVQVRVSGADYVGRRLELAMPAWEPREGGQRHESEPAPITAEVQGVVQTVERGGVRVRLDDGRMAWLPERNAPLTPGQLMAHRYRVGHTITARLVPDEKGRATLSQLEDRSGEETAWRSQITTQGQQTMGTLGDLFSFKKKR